MSNLREKHQQGGLDERQVNPDPVRQFARWYRDAVDSGIVEAKAMTLATATPGGIPSARMVLLKGFDERGFVFFTNYQSRKAAELEANPRAALVFYWAPLHRQVRIGGTIERVTRRETEDYFRTRPRGSQLSAWASHQSWPVESRGVLEARLEELRAQYVGGPIPPPPDWGGYRLLPATIEFWQGHPNRLHDRLLYTHSRSGWHIERLQP